jgi:Flp pilus assembly protein TadB
MTNFRREFSSSKDSCDRKEIDDESRRESQVDVFIAVILSLRAAFSLNHLAVFVTFAFVVLVFVVLVFVVVAFSLRARM